jgi:hypothetical protein
MGTCDFGQSGDKNIRSHNQEEIFSRARIFSADEIIVEHCGANVQ